MNPKRNVESVKNPKEYLVVFLLIPSLRDLLTKIWGAFHSTKISENSGSKSNGTEIFRKFISKISVHLSRLSFFLGIWKFRKFPVPFGISTRFESAPAPLVAKSYKMAAILSSRHYRHWMQNDLP